MWHWALVTLSINDTQLTMLCHCVECHYAESRILFIIVLNAIMLSVVMLNVVTLRVMAPSYKANKLWSLQLMGEQQKPGKSNWRGRLSTGALLQFICGRTAKTKEVLLKGKAQYRRPITICLWENGKNQGSLTEGEGSVRATYYSLFVGEQ